MARWLAAASAVLVTLLAALFALVHNLPGRDPRLAAPPVAVPAPPAEVPAVVEAPPAPPPVAKDEVRVAPPLEPPPAVAPPRPVPPVAKAVAPAVEPALAPKPVPVAPKIDPERIAVGERAYARLGCALCHSIGGRGNPASPLDGVGARLDRQALYELTTGTGAAAEVLGQALARRKARAVNDPDMDELIDYLAQLR